MSEPYLKAIANADRCVSRTLDACARNGKEPVVMLLSDHGGHDRSHGTEAPEDMTIPWILAGPGIRRTELAPGSVRIYDTCTTVAALLGLPQAREWDGRIVTEALEPQA
jgi:arylsulfatase A-like enzyme